MPLLLIATSIYVAFSIVVCVASSHIPKIDAMFSSQAAKSLPIFVILALVAFLR